MGYAYVNRGEDLYVSKKTFGRLIHIVVGRETPYFGLEREGENLLSLGSQV